MSDPQNNPLDSLLTNFALGPAWARSGADAREPHKQKTFRDDSRGDRRDMDRDARSRDRNAAPRPARPLPPVETRPAEGVTVAIVPCPQAVHTIGKEIHQVARVYSLFDVAKTLLSEKSRLRVVFEIAEGSEPLLLGKKDDSLFLTKEDALKHLWNSNLLQELLEEETIEVDPPNGNFQAIARCGLTQTLLGPVNFHAYQSNLRKLHREKLSHMPLEAVTARVKIERGEEAVQLWLDGMKKQTRWRLKGDEHAEWFHEIPALERALGPHLLETAYQEVRKAEVAASIPAQNLSAGLWASLKAAGSHARQHPAFMIPAVCRAAEAEHLPVFKRQGKLFTGPARPHSLPLDAVLAERPAIMVQWIRENTPAKLEGLWKAVLPEGSTAPPADFAADLFWLLQQGHILLHTDDTLVVQEPRTAAEPPAEGSVPSGKKKKKKKKKSTASDVVASDGMKVIAEEAIAESIAPDEIASAALEPGPIELAELEPNAVDDQHSQIVEETVSAAEENHPAS